VDKHEFFFYDAARRACLNGKALWLSDDQDELVRTPCSGDGTARLLSSLSRVSRSWVEADEFLRTDGAAARRAQDHLTVLIRLVTTLARTYRVDVGHADAPILAAADMWEGHAAALFKGSRLPFLRWGAAGALSDVIAACAEERRKLPDYLPYADHHTGCLSTPMASMTLWPDQEPEVRFHHGLKMK
jgi:hypothetical protein